MGNFRTAAWKLLPQLKCVKRKAVITHLGCYTQALHPSPLTAESCWCEG